MKTWDSFRAFRSKPFPRKLREELIQDQPCPEVILTSEQDREKLEVTKQTGHPRGLTLAIMKVRVSETFKVCKSERGTHAALWHAVRENSPITQ